MKHKDIFLVIGLTILILLFPLLANHRIEGWNWEWYSFVLAGVLLAGTGITYVLIVRKFPSPVYRAAIGLALATGFVLMWANCAVGIIGSEDDPANLMYLGLMAVGSIGALLTRFRARRMAYLLCVLAVLQMLIPVIALLVLNSDFVPGVFSVFVFSALFSILFLVSAGLFFRAECFSSEIK